MTLKYFLMETRPSQAEHGRASISRTGRTTMLLSGIPRPTPGKTASGAAYPPTVQRFRIRPRSKLNTARTQESGKRGVWYHRENYESLCAVQDRLDASAGLCCRA